MALRQGNHCFVVEFWGRLFVGLEGHVMSAALQELLRLIAADVVKQLISGQQEGNSQTGLADALKLSSCSPQFERKT